MEFISIKEMDLMTFLIWAPISVVVCIILFYVLWINGYLIKSSKTSLVFIGSLRRHNRCKLRFKCCNGHIKKVIKIRESRNYEFTFNSNIRKGHVTAEIQDKSKKILLQLSKDNPKSAIRLEKNNRYFLVIRFANADGEFDLAWD